ncbi:MAG: sulfite exporter TauE/SafE family protein [Bifidobacteriaceae bacterium]|jgi:sulfite exporter TauE/SafE/copper chaperone CopZ|nr:sulfite exporter TauE/SafE family protein [Bifidobacteriaceae bacterium]
MAKTRTSGAARASGARRTRRPTGIRTTVPISGMTCGACEVRVGKVLRRMPGVVEAKVSLARGTATLIAESHVPAERIDAALDPAGYHVGSTALPLLARDTAVWRDVAVSTAVIVGLLAGASALGLGNLHEALTGGAGAESLMVVAALGVVASLSTCMALVGGLVLSLAARFAKAHPDLSPARRLRPHAMFNLGRVVGFAALGSLLGGVGAAFSVSGHALALVTIAVALVMGVVGLKLTGVSPRATRASITLPAALSGWMGRLEARRGYRDSTALALGAGSFFLPCGFTQAVQVYALSTGSPPRAGLIMAVFALGTTPGLFAAGAAGSLVSGRWAAHLFRAAGVVVLAFALVNAVGAVRMLAPNLAVMGAGVGAGTSNSVTSRSDNVVDDAGTQVLTTVQDGGGYTPGRSVVYAGRPVRWEITSKGLSCASSMNLQAMGLGYVSLATGLNVFEFTPTEPGTLVYTCGMGMFPATIEVIPPPSDAATPSPKDRP